MKSEAYTVIIGLGSNDKEQFRDCQFAKLGETYTRLIAPLLESVFFQKGG